MLSLSSNLNSLIDPILIIITRSWTGETLEASVKIILYTAVSWDLPCCYPNALFVKEYRTRGTEQVLNSLIMNILI